MYYQTSLILHHNSPKTLKRYKIKKHEINQIKKVKLNGIRISLIIHLCKVPQP